jgi:hypothetical protein
VELAQQPGRAGLYPGAPAMAARPTLPGPAPIGTLPGVLAPVRGTLPGYQVAPAAAAGTNPMAEPAVVLGPVASGATAAGFATVSPPTASVPIAGRPSVLSRPTLIVGGLVGGLIVVTVGILVAARLFFSGSPAVPAAWPVAGPLGHPSGLEPSHPTSPLAEQAMAAKDYRGCINATMVPRPIEADLRTRASCATLLGDLDALRKACAQYGRSYPQPEKRNWCAAMIKLRQDLDGAKRDLARDQASLNDMQQQLRGDTSRTAPGKGGRRVRRTGGYQVAPTTD